MTVPDLQLQRNLELQWGAILLQLETHMKTYFKIGREGLGIAVGDYCLAISWQSFNKFAFAYLTGNRGFGWSQHIGFVKWRKR